MVDWHRRDDGTFAKCESVVLRTGVDVYVHYDKDNNVVGITWIDARVFEPKTHDP